CFNVLARGGLASRKTGATIDELLTALDPQTRRSNEDRQASAAALTTALVELNQRAPDPHMPKLPALRQVFARVPNWHTKEADHATKAALAGVLAQAHLAMHTIVKPDELARSRATALYRGKNPAANAAAEAIVFYPTDLR
ncbi:MAG: hypothetical protein ACRCZF_06450, partial [Gemmataceae bacterium]